MDDFDFTSQNVRRQPLAEVSNLLEPRATPFCLDQQSAGQMIAVDEWTPSYNRETIRANRMTYKKLLTTVLSSCRQAINRLMDAVIINRRRSCTTCGADMNLSLVDSPGPSVVLCVHCQ